MDPARRLRTLGLCITLSVWGAMGQNTSAQGASENCSDSVNCPSNAKCVNSTHCTCLDGFQSLGDRFFTEVTAACDDINECLQPKPPDCGPNANCINKPGSYHCICANGYASSSGKDTFMNASENDCRDIDECGELNRTVCGPHATCTNMPGSYNCTCVDGYASRSGRANFMNASENDCHDIDECGELNRTVCGPHATCTNMPGSYNCTCTDGYESSSGKVKFMNASENDCQDIDECLGPSRVDCRPHAICNNVPVSYNCTCVDGYKSSSGKAWLMNKSENDCQDIDECLGPSRLDCGPNATCTNVPGSYNCTCVDGYESRSGRANFMNASEKACQDIDECGELNRTVCGPHATCTNMPGSYNCTCTDGYESSSGKVKFMNASENDCQDIDECQRNATVCEPYGNCINTPGSYICKCKLGFGKSHKDPTKTCKDINECQQSNATRHCGDNTMCVNTPGSYKCVCAPGYFSINNTSPCEALTCPQLLADNPTEAQTLLGNFSANMDRLCKSELSTLKNMTKSNDDNGQKMLQRFLDILESQMNTISLRSKDVKQRHQIATELMSKVEKLLRTMALFLPEGTTGNRTSQGTELRLKVSRDGYQSREAVRLQHSKTQMELKWTAAEGKKIEGFTLAGLLTYQGLSPVLEGAERVEAAEWDTIGQERWWLREPGHSSYHVVSEVVSAFVNDPMPQALNHSPNITFVFSYPKPESRKEQHILCAYWEPSSQSWSTMGCTQLPLESNSTHSHTHCQCNHLTSFAVLMAFYEVEDWALDVITMVGLVISLVCLLLSIITFLFCHALKGPRATIHLHLCLSLFVAYVVFLAGAGSTSNKEACGVVAGLLHYFFLAAFCWMWVEGAELYLMVVQVFTRLKRLHMFLLGYGVPAVIVGISAAANKAGYGTEKYCWLSKYRGFLWSFLAPVCLIIAVNAMIFVVTVWKLAQKFTDINPNMGQLKKFRVLTITAIAQLCILGITWIFGIFQFSHRCLVVSYIFTILNTLQGLFIFLLHCLLKKQVRDEYRRWLCCGSLKYSEFSSSSASSTRKGLQPSQESGF